MGCHGSRTGTQLTFHFEFIEGVSTDLKPGKLDDKDLDLKLVPNASPRERPSPDNDRVIGGAIFKKYESTKLESLLNFHIAIIAEMRMAPLLFTMS